MTVESIPRRLRVAMISFMTAASGAGLLIWARVGSTVDRGATYFNLYPGLAVFLFVPSLFAGMVAGLGAVVAYGVAAFAVMCFLTQGLFSAWVTLVSALVLGLVAIAIVHLWRCSDGRQFRGAPDGESRMADDSPES